jgi:uncharacterized membrane-anchored protein
MIAGKILLPLAIVALAQTGVLAGMVIDRVRLLTTGREITLPIVPVDPRDFFRGEYVRLGYDIDRVPASLLEGPAPRRNAPFYVTLEQKDGGPWQPVKVTRTLREEGAADRIVLKARAASRWGNFANPSAVQWVRYGIESYFVPQGQGPELEKLARDKKLAAVIAVDRRGNAAIKGILIEGRGKIEDPLF